MNQKCNKCGKYITYYGTAETGEMCDCDKGEEKWVDQLLEFHEKFSPLNRDVYINCEHCGGQVGPLREIIEKALQQERERIIEEIRNLPRSDDTPHFQAGEENTISRIIETIKTLNQ